MRNSGFEGWYFKHQKEKVTVAFIVGRAQNGSFLQAITPKGTEQFEIDDFQILGDDLYGKNFSFSKRGCTFDMPGLQGTIAYGPQWALRSDIMGPFRYLPMECSHGIISMGHRLSGSLTIAETTYDFDGGMGYIEKDCGISFPSAYQWVQCNNFSENCSLMLSVANIPFGGFHFNGCICAILYDNREYRLATYKGAEILAATATHIRLAQGRLLLELDMLPCDSGHELLAPVQGKMNGRIRESHNAFLHMRLWERGNAVIDLQSEGASYEYVPKIEHYTK